VRGTAASYRGKCRLTGSPGNQNGHQSWVPKRNTCIPHIRRWIAGNASVIGRTVKVPRKPFTGIRAFVSAVLFYAILPVTSPSFPVAYSEVVLPRGAGFVTGVAVI